MDIVYKLSHRHLTEIDDDGEEIYSSILLGFFSTEEICKIKMSFYTKQPGFREYPNGFIIEAVEADLDEFNDEAGEFDKTVFFLSHEYYDGEYDYVSCLGYYSTLEKAQIAERKYRLDSELIEYQEGFCIDEYKIDEGGWLEGFFIW